MHAYAEVTKDISRAAAAIAEGRVVAFPTNTSYGLAVDALQGHALQRLRNVKGRSEEKTFTIFLQPALWDEFLVLTGEEKQLLAKYANQGLTLLVRPKPALEHVAQDGLVGLRVIDHPLMSELAQAVTVPLTATSANVSDAPACYDVDCIQSAFPGLLDATDTRHGDIARAGESTYDLSLAVILDGGILPKKQPTTIARIVGGRVSVIRQGDLAVDH